jgi:hypothetical protein
MTNETDSTRRRPPTIELKATEVAPEKSAAAEPGRGAAGAGIRAEASAAQPSGGASARTLVATALAGIAGGVIGAVVIGTGLWFAGYGPDRAAPPVPNYGAAVADISARLKKLESAGQSQPAPAQPQPDPALASRLSGAEAATKSLSDQLAALNRHLDEVAGAAQNALTQAKSAASAATAAADVAKNATQNASQASAARDDLDALAARMTALEGAIKKLTDETRQTASAELDGRALRLALASAALRTAVERGTPYGAELAAAKSLGADPAAIAALEPFAASGVSSAASLAHELSALIPALQQAVEPTSSNATFLDRLERNAQRLVRITPAEAPAGDDPATVATRIGVDASRADLTAALADIAKLPDTAKPVAAVFVQKAQARNAALAASAKLAADALKSLGKPQ